MESARNNQLVQMMMMMKVVIVGSVALTVRAEFKERVQLMNSPEEKKRSVIVTDDGTEFDRALSLRAKQQKQNLNFARFRHLSSECNWSELAGFVGQLSRKQLN
jgi:hypothetical protein